MVRISTRIIQHFLQSCKDSEEETDKGKALEDLICYIFNKIPGVTLRTRDQKNIFGNQEIDLVFWNEQHPYGLKFFHNIILVECKNWSKPVGANEVKLFDVKFKDRD